MPDQPMEERIAEALNDHHDWGYGIALNTMYCNHRDCDWSAQLVPNRVASATYRAHQAAVVAGIVREASQPPKADPKLKWLAGERKSLAKHLDSWESQGHTTVTIKYLRRFLDRKDAQ